MLKALFFDMDETLCDTHGANQQAQALMAQALHNRYGADFSGDRFAEDYLSRIYRQWQNKVEEQRYLSIIADEGEKAFRTLLIRDLLTRYNVNSVSDTEAAIIQEKFDIDRINAFSFYPGVADFLAEASALFTLVVITNGPEYSQVPKVRAVNLAEHVDYIIIGGQEPEQKPARSIFEKALKLANCEAHEAIHVGDSLQADIAGARNSGITSVWIQHQQPLDAKLGIHPDHTVMKPEEIPELIRALHA